MTPAQYAALDALETLNTCLQAVADLIVPDAEIQALQRDRLAVLLDYLNTEQHRAAEVLRRHLAS